MSKSCKLTLASARPKMSDSRLGWSINSVKLALKHVGLP
jgi:hypothetical protein